MMERARRSEWQVKRDRAAHRAFLRSSPCPATGRTSGACPSYVVNHIVVSNRGGANDSVVFCIGLSITAEDSALALARTPVGRRRGRSL